MLNIKTESRDGATTLALKGRLDTVTAPDLENALRGCTGGDRELVIDLAQLDYISSAGLRVLMAAHKAVRGRMRIVNANEMVQEVFDVTGFSEVLNIG